MLDLPASGQIRRILIIKWSAMGDVVIASALFEDIRRAFPEAELHLNTLPAWQHLFAHDPRFQRLLLIDIRDRHHPLRQAWTWLQQVRAQHYDLIIDLQSTDRSRWLVALASIGRTRWRMGNNRHYPYTIQPPPLPRSTHILHRMQAALHGAGIATPSERPQLHIPAENQHRTAHLLQTHGLQSGQFALLFPGCNRHGWLKRWPRAAYAQLARRLVELGLTRCVLIGGPDEQDDCREIAQLAGDCVLNLCGQTQILDIPPLAAHARLLIANDTGTAHLASASSTPMVVLCGPTDPRRVKPLGQNVSALQAELPCINCYRKHCEHHSCMQMLSVEQLIQHLYQRALL